MSSSVLLPRVMSVSIVLPAQGAVFVVCAVTRNQAAHDPGSRC